MLGRGDAPSVGFQMLSCTGRRLPAPRSSLLADSNTSPCPSLAKAEALGKSSAETLMGHCERIPSSVAKCREAGLEPQAQCTLTLSRAGGPGVQFPSPHTSPRARQDGTGELSAFEAWQNHTNGYLFPQFHPLRSPTPK